MNAIDLLKRTIQRSRFLGAWRFTGDIGSAAAPVLVSILTGVASIAIASGVMGVIGLIGAGMLLRYVPRYVPRPKRTPKAIS